jgi:hypothetical protein
MRIALFPLFKANAEFGNRQGRWPHGQIRPKREVGGMGAMTQAQAAGSRMHEGRPLQDALRRLVRSAALASALKDLVTKAHIESPSVVVEARNVVRCIQ